MTKFLNFGLLSLTVLGLTACPGAKSKDGGTTPVSSPITAATPASTSLYAVSGTCYAGGVGTNAPSNTIVKYDGKSGVRLTTVADYRVVAPGDSPISISGLDSNDVLVTVQNTNAQRIDRVHRDGSGGSSFLFNSAAFSTALRNIFTTKDGSFLVTRAAAVERFTSFRTRYLNGTSPYISNPTATACTGMATALTFSLELSNGNILVGSGAATPNNKIATFNPNGYGVAADCLASKAAPTTTAIPTAAVNAGPTTVFVSYASPAAADNMIIAYQFSSSAMNLSTATATSVLNSPSLLFGVSAMAFDSTNNYLYVANSALGGERIEKFSWDPTAGTLTRVGTTPFIQDPDLTCMSGLYLGEN